MSGERPFDGLSRRRYLTLSNAAAGAALVGGSAVAGSATPFGDEDDEPENDDEHTKTDLVLESHDGTEIAATVFRPEDATANEPVPMILHSHGWSGSRTTDIESFERELDRGYAVLSFDQRGHGDSGGEAHVQDPDLEGRDVIRVLDYVDDLRWIERSPGRKGKPDDPRVFAIGGSYGGGYQLVGAFAEIAEKGHTRFDALAPEITWYDLSESLAPEGVIRTVWASLLYAAGAPNVPDHVHRGFAWGIVTGQWPEGDVEGVPDLDSTFFENGSSGFVEDGHQLDVPVLFGQGIDDNLFNLNQAWQNFERALTDDARERSAVVGYNGGHALPNAFPRGDSESGNACSDGFAERRLEFFEAVCKGSDARDVTDAAYELTTMDGDHCVKRPSLEPTKAYSLADTESDVEEVADLSEAGFNAVTDLVTETSVSVGLGEEDDTLEIGLGEDPFDELTDPLFDGLEEALFEDEDDGREFTTGVGTPEHIEIEDVSDEAVTVAGVPFVNATVTTGSGEQRLFFALSVGEDEDDATVVQNNMLPLREPEPVEGADREIELPGVAVEVSEDEKLFLTVSAVSDMSVLHGSRAPGTVTLEDVTVDVPVVPENEMEPDDGDENGDDENGDDGDDDDENGDDGDDDGENGDDGDDDGENGDDENGDGEENGDGDAGEDENGDDGDDDDGDDGDDDDGDGGDDDSMPGPGIIGTLGTLGGVGYLLRRRLGDDGSGEA